MRVGVEGGKREAHAQALRRARETGWPGSGTPDGRRRRLDGCRGMLCCEWGRVWGKGGGGWGEWERGDRARRTSVGKRNNPPFTHPLPLLSCSHHTNTPTWHPTTGPAEPASSSSAPPPPAAPASSSSPPPPKRRAPSRPSPAPSGAVGKGAMSGVNAVGKGAVAGVGAVGGAALDAAVHCRGRCRRPLQTDGRPVEHA